MGGGGNSAEEQLEALLASPGADYKLALDVNEKLTTYFSMAEEYLWPSGKGNRRIPWKDLALRARCSPAWPWMPGANGLEALKTEALRQGRWRLGEDGYIEKGPFPKEKTSLNVSVEGSNPETGETHLHLTPRHAGDSPVIRYSTKPEISDADPLVEDPDNFYTPEGTLYFQVRDTTGTHETGLPVRWVAELKIRHEVEPVADKRRITLQSTPRAALAYTLDGSSPRDGIQYEAPFEIGAEPVRLLVFASSGEASVQADFQIPASGSGGLQIDERKPARLKKRVTLDTTDRVFETIKKFRESPETLFHGVRIEIGEAENTVTVRFQARPLTAAMLEKLINGLREALQEHQTEVTVTLDSADFESGFSAKEFARIANMKLNPSELTQEA